MSPGPGGAEESDPSPRSAAPCPSRVETVSQPRPSSFPDPWYDLTTASHFWVDWRLRAFLRMLAGLGVDARRPAQVLDVGCGNGLTGELLERRTGWTVDGADLNMAALERARPGRGRLLYYDILEERPEFLGRYDRVLMLDVLEHIPEPAGFVRAALRHLRPGGTLFVGVPACMALFSVYDRAAGHLRRYSRASLAAELSAGGARVVDSRYWGFSLLPVLAARKLLLRGGRPVGDIIRSGFRPPGRAVNALCRWTGAAETALLRRPPLGASLLAAAVSR